MVSNLFFKIADDKMVKNEVFLHLNKCWKNDLMNESDDWSEQAKIQEYKKELSTDEKKIEKIIMIVDYVDLNLENLQNKSSALKRALIRRAL